jgi:uncharacterized membrane protein
MANKPVRKEDSKPLLKAEAELVKIDPTIFDGLNPNKKEQVLQAFSISKFHSGPLPSPETLQEYENIVPGCAKTIFDVFVKQADHRMGLEKIVVTSQQTQSKWGQNYAFIIAIFVMTGAVACVLLGHDRAGEVLGSVDLVGLVTVFILGRQYQKGNLERKRPKPLDATSK